MGFAQKVRQRKPNVKGGISEVNHFVIEQNQFALVDECVLGTEVAVNKTVFVA